MRHARIAAALLAIGTASASAQAPAFEAASIRPTTGTDLPGALTDLRAGGQFSATNATVLDLVRVAWNIEPYRIVGGPDWIRADRFDVEARTGAAITADETRLRLGILLEPTTGTIDVLVIDGAERLIEN